MISKQKGFSLIEVLISLSLLTIGVMGLIKLHVFIDKKADMILNSIGALYVAESKLEYFQGYSTAMISYDEITTQTAPEHNKHYQLTWSVSPSEPVVISNKMIHTLKEITVMVTWQDRWSDNHQLKLKTMVSWYDGLSKHLSNNLPKG